MQNSKSLRGLKVGSDNGTRVRTVAIVPAAGSGKRLGLKTKKPFLLLGGKPLIFYALSALESSRLIDGIIVAVEKSSPERFKNLIRRYGFKKIIDVVIGGRTRHESVRNCLEKIGHSFDIVLIHDGARPFIDKGLIEGSINLARIFGGCIAAVPESDTVKRVDKNLFVKKTLDRFQLWRAQTPQAFRYHLIKRAYTAKGKDTVTDDAALVENLGKRIKILKGSYRNIKVTTKVDLKFAEVLL